MTPAEKWLHALGHGLATYGLYAAGHQARGEAVGRLFAASEALLRAELRPAFTFLDGSVIFGALPVHGLRDYAWGKRLAAVGIRRLELSRDLTRGSLDDCLAGLHARLSGEIPPDAPVPAWLGIHAGEVVLKGEAEPGAGALEDGARSLREEVGLVKEVFERVGAGGRLPVEDVEAVVRALALALHAEGELLVPLLALRSLDDHTTLHAVNTAVLAMTFSEWLGLAGGDIRAVGKAALLHDVGMARVSAEVFREAALSAGARGELSRHPEEGARLLLARGAKLDLAATVAYEHHLRMDGAGYPGRRFHRDLHYISRIIAVCGAYDALRSERSYRPARPPEAALREIEAGAGTVYDPGVAQAFVQMMRRWEHRMVTVRL